MKTTFIACGALVATLICGTAWAVRDRAEIGLVSPRSRLEHETKVTSPARAGVTDNSQTIGVNNIRMFVTNTGSFAWDKVDAGQPAGLEFPKGTGKTAVFAAGLWLGATINGSIHLAISEYSDEYQPGSAVVGVPDNPDKAEYKVYKLERIYSDPVARDVALGN